MTLPTLPIATERLVLGDERARLDAAQKQQLSGYNQQLASLFSDFNANLLADEGTNCAA